MTNPQTQAGTKVRVKWAHPNNLYTVISAGKAGMYVRSSGGIVTATNHEDAYEGEPTEAHWSAYLARNAWARR